MSMKSIKTKIKYIIATCTLLIVMFSSFALATSATLDVTPPMGKVVIKDATTINNIHYVGTANIEVIIDAKDDISPANEIKYYISTSPISDTSEVTTWYDYSAGKTENVTISTTGKTTIYAVFKDAAGNTSLIYSGGDTQYTIEYNVNADDAVPFTSTVATTAYYGMPFMVTMQAPTRQNYYFKGWSTNPGATDPSFKKGEIIPADTFVGGSKTITLYAVWGQSSNGSVLLSDVVEIGDYVAYPVSYENVMTCTYNGWRVISKNVDLDGNVSEGTVNLVSAGIPLTYYASSALQSHTETVKAITTNFLITPFSNGVRGAYDETGFLLTETLTETFTNKYTATKEDGITPKVRNITLNDIQISTGDSSISYNKYVDADEYESLYHADSTSYWLDVTTTSGTKGVYIVNSTGRIEIQYTSSSRNLIQGIRPVVSLKSDVVTTGQDMVGAWILE